MTPDQLMEWSSVILAIAAAAWTLYQEIRHKINHGTHAPIKK